MRKIGIYGGTFDPIHLGHIQIAKRFADELTLDAVIFVPAAVPPHKERPGLANGEDRLAMCKLAIEGQDKLLVSDMEILRGGKSYTADTLLEFRESYQDSEFYLLTGADMFLTLETWLRFPDIARMAVLCTVPRENDSAKTLCRYAEHLREKYHAKTVVLNLPPLLLSSTKVREEVIAGRSIDRYVPKPVAEYIKTNHLYRGTDSRKDIETEWTF